MSVLVSSCSVYKTPSIWCYVISSITNDRVEMREEDGLWKTTCRGPLPGAYTTSPCTVSVPLPSRVPPAADRWSCTTRHVRSAPRSGMSSSARPGMVTM